MVNRLSLLYADLSEAMLSENFVDTHSFLCVLDINDERDLISIAKTEVQENAGERDTHKTDELYLNLTMKGLEILDQERKVIHEYPTNGYDAHTVLNFVIDQFSSTRVN